MATPDEILLMYAGSCPTLRLAAPEMACIDCKHCVEDTEIDHCEIHQGVSHDWNTPEEVNFKFLLRCDDFEEQRKHHRWLITYAARGPQEAGYRFKNKVITISPAFWLAAQNQNHRSTETYVLLMVHKLTELEFIALRDTNDVGLSQVDMSVLPSYWFEDDNEKGNAQET